MQKIHRGCEYQVVGNKQHVKEAAKAGAKLFYRLYCCMCKTKKMLITNCFTNA